jgi:putative flippase GtrA
VAGAPWWLAIGVGYVVATSTHFVLHRTVVFAREDGFALTLGQQIPRFVAVVLCQYAVTTLAMTWLPDALGLPEGLVFLAVAGTVTVASFVLLRTRLFH